MAATDFYVPASKRTRLAQIYRRVRRGRLIPAPQPHDYGRKPALLLGGEGLVSTAEDYSRFCLMLLNGGELDGVRILQPESVEMMTRNRLSDLYPDESEMHGFGGGVNPLGEYFWSGQAGTAFWIDLEYGVYGILLVQSSRYMSHGYAAFSETAYDALGLPDTEPCADRGADGAALQSAAPG